MYNGTVLAKHSYLNISGLKLYGWKESDTVSLYFEAKVLTFIVFVKLFEQQFFYDFMFVSCATLQISYLHKSKRNMIMILILSTKG